MHRPPEIVLVPFPYSDLSSSRRRPVLIIFNNNHDKNYSDIMGVAITIEHFKDNHSAKLYNEDLESGMLWEPSKTKCHKLFTIGQSQVLKRFSILKEKKFDKIVPLNKRVQKSN